MSHTLNTTDPLRPRTTPIPTVGANGEGANVLAYERAFDANANASSGAMVAANAAGTLATAAMTAANAAASAAAGKISSAQATTIVNDAIAAAIASLAGDALEVGELTVGTSHIRIGDSTLTIDGGALSVDGVYIGGGVQGGE